MIDGSPLGLKIPGVTVLESMMLMMMMLVMMLMLMMMMMMILTMIMIIIVVVIVVFDDDDDDDADDYDDCDYDDFDDDDDDEYDYDYDSDYDDYHGDCSYCFLMMLMMVVMVKVVIKIIMMMTMMLFMFIIVWLWRWCCLSCCWSLLGDDVDQRDAAGHRLVLHPPGSMSSHSAPCWKDLSAQRGLGDLAPVTAGNKAEKRGGAMGDPQNGSNWIKLVGLCWFIMVNPFKMDDLGVPPWIGSLGWFMSVYHGKTI